jgi:hypothetical protein
MVENTDNTIPLVNAPHWLNHSHVLIKEDYLAEDEEWIANQTTKIVNQGTQNAQVEIKAGSTNILLVKRMVVSGVVAVNRANGRVKTVNLPQEAAQLLAPDLAYIAAQINQYNQPMTQEQQSDFLPSANGPSLTPLSPMNPPQISISDASSTVS